MQLEIMIQCALTATTINGDSYTWDVRSTLTHCRIALWSHQSAQTASSEQCIVQTVNVSTRDSPPNP